jgi:hypothetical protein
MAGPHFPCALLVASRHQYTRAVGAARAAEDCNSDAVVRVAQRARSAAAGRQAIELFHAQVEQSGGDVCRRAIDGYGARAVHHVRGVVTAHDRHEVFRHQPFAEMLRDQRFEQLAPEAVGIERYDHQACLVGRMRDEGDTIAERGSAEPRRRNDQRRHPAVYRIGEQHRRRKPLNLRQERWSALHHGGELRRPRRRSERKLWPVETLHLCRLERAPVRQVDSPHQRRRHRRCAPCCVGGGDRGRRILIEPLAIDLEGDEKTRQLGVELLGELGRACPQAGAHPFALGVAHLAQPSVLDGGQRAKQREQHDGGRELPGTTVHDNHCTRKIGKHPAVYISYKMIAER